MSDQTFVTYQKFNSKSEILELAQVLNDHEIEFELEDNTMNTDGSFSNNEINKDYRLKLRADDFDQVNEIRTTLSGNLIDAIDADYYLFDFTNEELIDLVAKSDEWSHFDVLLAKKILKERGTELSDEQVSKLKTERLEELSKPEDSQPGWVAAGYIMAFLGGLIGILIGWHLSSHKKTLPNGEQVYGYSESTRKHGRRILILGLVMILISLATRVLLKVD